MLNMMGLASYYVYDGDDGHLHVQFDCVHSVGLFAILAPKSFALLAWNWGFKCLSIEPIHIAGWILDGLSFAK